MGLGDKFKDLRKQAQEAVSDHKDQIQDAMGVAAAAVDKKTHGKHTAKIAKFGQKASDAMEKFGEDAEPAGKAEQPEGEVSSDGAPRSGADVAE